MNRRKFFSNLVGSVSVLVSAYALPLQRVMSRLNVNPAYTNAETVIHFWFAADTFVGINDAAQFVTPVIYEWYSTKDITT